MTPEQKSQKTMKLTPRMAAGMKLSCRCDAPLKRQLDGQPPISVLNALIAATRE